jgi:hypothetical protein
MNEAVKDVIRAGETNATNAERGRARAPETMHGAQLVQVEIAIDILVMEIGIARREDKINAATEEADHMDVMENATEVETKIPTLSRKTVVHPESSPLVQ